MHEVSKKNSTVSGRGGAEALSAPFYKEASDSGETSKRDGTDNNNEKHGVYCGLIEKP